ncbi:MAG: sporulation integral membrane protein YtvI [Anaerofustis stercorihominis]|nr:sporulation integral membrane protein YtvI [Anaerofustis stercorihominis]
MNSDQTEKRRRFIINFVYFAIISAIVVFIARYALGVLLPFAIALVVSSVIRPVIKAMKRKWNMKNNAAAIIAVLVFYSIIVCVLLLILISIGSAVMDLVSALPELYNTVIEPALTKAVNALSEFFNKFGFLGASFDEDAIFDFVASLGTTISTFSMSLISVAGSTAASLPSLLLNTVISVIATAFLSVDWDNIKNFIYYQFSEQTQLMFDNIGQHLKKVLKQYIVAYATIMFITFAEIFLGLLLLRVNNAMLIAALIAIADIMPVVGSGIILLPWAVISILASDIGRGIGLFILWAVVSVIRNIIEPKIIGDNVGLHPLVALTAMISGTYIFGPIGLLGFPVALALIQSLNDAGVIHLYKSPPKTAPTVIKDNEEGTIGFKEIFGFVFEKLFAFLKFLKEKFLDFIEWAKNKRS